MAKKQVVINNFSGGIADDIRQQSANSFAISQHFDNLSSPNKLTPYRDTEADNTTQVGIMNFAWDGTNTYGLGLTLSGGLKAQIYSKTGLNASWGTPSVSTGGSATNLAGNTFIWYKSWLYFFAEGAGLSRWQSGTYTATFSSFTSTAYTDGSRNATQGIIHGKTNTLYIGYHDDTGHTSYIFSLHDTTANATALTLPGDMVPTALAEYGPYLAIFCRPEKSGSGNSKVFLWDMTSTDVTDVINFGAGDLWVGANVEGMLVGVMSGATSSDITFTNSKVFVKTYAGGTPQLFKVFSDAGLVIAGPTVVTTSATGYKPFYSSINGLTFGLYSTGSLVPTGLYTFSRANASYPFAITSERAIFNSTAITNLAGIFKVGDVVFVSYNIVANTSSNVGRTNDTALYTATSFVETVKFNGGDTAHKKKLIGVALSTASLPSGATMTLKYKRDAESSYTTISSQTTLSSIIKESLNIESTGKNLGDFYEVQFRFESTGGGEPTGYKFIFDDAQNLLNMK